ncbi:PilZ domain-containing protein [Pseudomonas sp. NPDC007930]|uniref:PilZ domain-containing protein n=1 Tax=Pseudomonas sp. NPDC007930 TaxID=3364417 RepID=UPI0036E43BE2
MNRLDYSEKRDFIRMAMDAEVTLRTHGQTLRGVCRDLSSNGMQVEARCPAQEGEQMNVIIPSRHPELADLDALCEVVRVEPAGVDGQLLGLRILEMDGVKIA